MKILSLDVGLKNLSYCVLETSNGKDVKILRWDNICVLDGNIKKTSLEVLTEHVLQALIENFDDGFVADLVLIENQPMLKNGLMKTVSVVIYTYFNMMKLQFGNVSEVKFISATNKLTCKRVKDLEQAATNTYKDRKKTSVELAKLHIQALCPEKLHWFTSHKKADDIADSLNQAISFIERKYNTHAENSI